MPRVVIVTLSDPPGATDVVANDRLAPMAASTVTVEVPPTCIPAECVEVCQDPAENTSERVRTIRASGRNVYRVRKAGLIPKQAEVTSCPEVDTWSAGRPLLDAYVKPAGSVSTTEA